MLRFFFFFFFLATLFLVMHVCETSMCTMRHDEVHDGRCFCLGNDVDTRERERERESPQTDGKKLDKSR